jgi:Holliday junction DNA helicase RuvA
MIAHIHGRLQFKSPECLVVDVEGLGYEIQVPLTTFYDLPDIGSMVALHVHTHVREDALRLFGFQSREEKELFVQLMTVAGIGPRLAVNILSGISPAELEETVRQADITRLISIPGVGRKTAERMMVDLRDKLPGLALKHDLTFPIKQATDDAIRGDALSALLNLGYRKPVAQRAIEAARKRLQGNPTLETLLKEALRSLA